MENNKYTPINTKYIYISKYLRTFSLSPKIRRYVLPESWNINNLFHKIWPIKGDQGCICNFVVVSTLLPVFCTQVTFMVLLPLNQEKKPYAI